MCACTTESPCCAPETSQGKYMSIKYMLIKKTGEAKESPEHTHIPCNQFFIPPEGSIYIGTLVTSINNN